MLVLHWLVSVPTIAHAMAWELLVHDIIRCELSARRMSFHCDPVVRGTVVSLGLNPPHGEPRVIRACGDATQLTPPLSKKSIRCLSVPLGERLRCRQSS
ncbi:hypothetical protein B0O80DRAFT_54946 [Mortierella sp. GBAus27b]|nr:hypothetical protein B0O80DRAFT_54946 [Mortierella sp. GBAus27b]